MSRRLQGTLTFTLTVILFTGADAFPQSVRVGVLGLFHPQEFTISACEGSALVLHAGRRTLVLEKSSGIDVAHIRLSGDTMVVEAASQIVHAYSIQVASRQSGPADFTLSIPGKITRRYRGTLDLKSDFGALLAVVSMDLETAVASVVAAESAPDTPLEALKAQAVAARSYLIGAKGRHLDFDFCDTTHCQFLRNPPAPGTPVAHAVAETRSLVLSYQSEPVAAMYTRSCSGRTRTPADVGLPGAGYPYYSVDCKHCREHPIRWWRQVPAHENANLRAANEKERLEVDRRSGWDAVPSNTFSRKQVGDHIILQGTGQGHGIGLCQAGAEAMAREGATFLAILAHYYPNTAIVSLDGLTAVVH